MTFEGMPDPGVGPKLLTKPDPDHKQQPDTLMAL
jgi:hypothetical protein